MAGLSRRAVDRIVEITEGYTALVESGERENIAADLARKYAESLGCSLDWLVAGRGRVPSKETVLAAVERTGRAA